MAVIADLIQSKSVDYEFFFSINAAVPNATIAAIK
jgi:hypothetical protein